MSLQVWLPLNGNLENKGLDANVKLSGTPKYKSGKISSNGLDMSSRLTATSTDMSGAEIWSVAFWFKTDTNSSLAGNWVDLCGMTDVSQTGVSGQFRFEACYGSSLRACSWHDNATNATINGSVTIAVDKDEWHHACVTVSDTEVKTYKDGVCIYTHTTGLGHGHLNGYFWLGETNAIAGCIQDFRLYNHCLSPKEVKEISKGLVLHYTLDNNGDGKNNLIKNSISAPNSFYDYTGKATASRIPSDGKVATNIYAINFPVDSATYSNYNLYCSFTRDESAVQKDGKTYTLSFKIKASKPLNNYSILYEYTNASISTNITTSWQTIKLTGVATGTYSALYLCRGVNNRSQINGNVLYIADLKLEEGSIGTAWCPAINDPLYSILGYNSKIEPDCSGLGNNGIKTSGITIDTNTPRHTTSLDFTTSDYICCGQGAKVTDALTANIWCYMDTWTNDPHPWSCTEGGGWNWENGDNGKIRFPIYLAGVGYKYTHSNKTWDSLSSGWHMFTATFDGLVVKTYLDGELDTVYQAATTKTLIGYNSTNSIFIHGEATSSATTPITGYKACKMSDARIYATALSAEDVKELYDTAAMIDNGNNAYTYDFIE